MNDLPDAIDRLATRIESLERRVEAMEPRVAALEHPPAASRPQPSSEKKEESTAGEAAPAAVRSGSLFPVLGKALLGIAGAYVLRAVEESSSLPKLAIALAGIVYAFLWLTLAARTRGRAQFASAIYACTSAMILAPMLWELTLRFNVVPPAIAAAVVCAYALAADGLAGKRHLAPLLRVASIAAATLALALAIASHAMMPFVVALLTLAAICEFAPQFDGLPDVRALVALAADAAIWILIFVYFNPENAREDYPPLGKATLLVPGFALLLLFAAGVIFRTMVRARKITAIETAQTTIAFLLAAVSLADFGPANSPILLGAICLFLSAASYAAVFTFFEHAEERRNAAVFAAWSAALLLAGSFLCLPPLPMILLLGACAVGAVVLDGRGGRNAFAFYGLVFLVTASATSGLLNFIAAVWIGTPSGEPAARIWLAAFSAVLCYAVAKPRSGGTWWAEALSVGIAALAAGAVSALVVQSLIALAAIHAVPGPHHLAFIRTLVLCIAALALVFGGARWRRLELWRLGYAAIGLVAVKLVFEDLRHGHLAYIAASIFLVALTLIAAPRFARARQKA